jgi:hypothetical protein
MGHFWRFADSFPYFSETAIGTIASINRTRMRGMFPAGLIGLRSACRILRTNPSNGVRAGQLGPAPHMALRTDKIGNDLVRECSKHCRDLSPSRFAPTNCSLPAAMVGLVAQSDKSRTRFEDFVQRITRGKEPANVRLIVVRGEPTTDAS